MCYCDGVECWRDSSTARICPERVRKLNRQTALSALVHEFYYNHVPQMRNENYQGMDRIMDLGNREVTAVYQRRQKKQAVAEHATAVTVESFYRII